MVQRACFVYCSLLPILCAGCLVLSQTNHVQEAFEEDNAAPDQQSGGYVPYAGAFLGAPAFGGAAAPGGFRASPGAGGAMGTPPTYRPSLQVHTASHAQA